MNVDGKRLRNVDKLRTKLVGSLSKRDLGAANTIPTSAIEPFENFRRSERSKIVMEESGATIATAEVDDDGLGLVETDEVNVAVANVDGEYFAFADTCTHQGCSLSTGRLDGSNVVCPCHGSTFDVTTGEVVSGPAARPVETYRVTVAGDKLEIDIA